MPLALYCWPFNATSTTTIAAFAKAGDRAATHVVDTNVPDTIAVSPVFAKLTVIEPVLTKLVPKMLTSVSPETGPVAGKKELTVTGIAVK